MGNLIPKNVAAPENVADTDPTGNVHSKNRLVETTRTLVDMCLTKLFG